MQHPPLILNRTLAANLQAAIDSGLLDVEVISDCLTEGEAFVSPDRVRRLLDGGPVTPEEAIDLMERLEFTNVMRAFGDPHQSYFVDALEQR